MKPESILCVINSISAGGAERMLQYVARLHGRDRLRFEICVLYATGREALVVPADVPVHVLGAGVVAGWYPGALIRLLFHIARSKPVLLFSVLAKSNVLAAAAGRLSGTPVVMSEHAPTALYIQDYRFPWLARAVMAPAYASARAIITVSQFCKDSISSIFPRCADMITVIPNGVDAEDIGKSAAEEQRIMHGRYIFSCGRLSPEKNFELLIRAVAAMKEMDGTTYPLCIAGEGPERGTLRSLAHALGVHLELPGFVDNPYPLMKGAAALAITSRYESFSVVALEAMACGTPVVAVDCPGGIAEVLRDSVNCHIVHDPTPGRVAAGLSRVLSDAAYAQQLKTNAARDVVERFDVKNMVNRYEQTLSDAVHGRKS